MAGKSLWRLWVVLQFFILAQFAAAQDVTNVLWCVDAQPEQWILHNDVIGFVSEPGKQDWQPSDIVTKTELTGTDRNLVVVHFKNGTTPENKSSYIEQLRQKGLTRHLIAVSKPAQAGSPFNNKILLIDNQVI